MPRSTKRRGATPTTDVYAEVTSRILDQLEAGVVPWRRPWDSTAGLPLSMSTRRPYRGVNPFLLGISGGIAGFTSPFWGTYNRIAALGGQVRKGERATAVILWRSGARTVVDEATDEETTKRWMQLRQYKVFNACQADGLDDKWMRRPLAEGEDDTGPIEPIDAAEAMIESYFAEGPTLGHGGVMAFYDPRRDHVQLPGRDDFVSAEGYYSTAFHEATHSTGHPDRLDRSLLEGHHFGDPSYAAEELIAEMGAAMACGVAGIDQADTLPASAAYLDNWMTVLRADSHAIVKAAAAAQRAVDLIAGVSFASDEDLEAAA